MLISQGLEFRVNGIDSNVSRVDRIYLCLRCYGFEDYNADLEDLMKLDTAAACTGGRKLVAFYYSY